MSPARPLRVALVGIRCYRRGGMGRDLLELAERLPEEAEVHVYARTFEHVRSARIRQHSVGGVTRPFLLQQVHFAWNATRAVEAGGYDVVHAQSMAAFRQHIVFFTSCYAALAAAMLRHGDRSRARWLRRMLGPLAQVERLQVRKGGHRAVTCPSRGTRRDLMEHYGLSESEIVVNPQGVDPEAFHPSRRGAHGAATRAEMGFGPHDRLLVFVGDEADRKGLPLVVDALSLVSDPAVKLVVVGAGPSVLDCKERAERAGLAERVRFLGGIGDPERVARILASSDLFVLPSWYESRCLAVLEAMASGLPVLGSRINGMEDDISDGVNGRFVAWSPDDIAAKVRETIGDEAGLRRMGQAARAYAETCSWQGMADRAWALYRRVAGRG